MRIPPVVLRASISFSELCPGRFTSKVQEGWSGDAVVLSKLPVPGRPTNLDKSKARAYCACSRCGLFGHFFSRVSFLFSFSLSLEDGPIYTETLSQRAAKLKTTNQQTNQPTNLILIAVHPFLTLCILDVYFYSVFGTI